MKKEQKIIIFIVGLVLTLVVAGFICYAFNNGLKAYYAQLASDYTNNADYYLSGGVSQQTINERIRNYTQLSNQSLNGEEPTVFMFAILQWIVVYCFGIANMKAGSKISVVLLKIAGVLSILAGIAWIAIFAGYLSGVENISSILNNIVQSNGINLEGAKSVIQIIIPVIALINILFGVLYILGSKDVKKINLACVASIIRLLLLIVFLMKTLASFNYWPLGMSSMPIAITAFSLICIVWGFFVFLSTLSIKQTEV